jgi:hypothetical protein
MPKFAFAYHGAPEFKSKEDGQAHMQKWMAWMDGMGDAVIERGMPFKDAKTLSKDGVTDGGGANPLTGITIVEAADMDAAIELAKGCPHLNGGTIEVAEAMDMPM